MTKLLVRRARFPFGEGVLVRGEIIDSDDFPQVDEHKWTQLIDQRFFEMVDRPRRAMTRADAEMARARGIELVEPAGVYTGAPARDPIVNTLEARTCDYPVLDAEGNPSVCGFVANAPHGLTVHRGRKHKE